MSQGVSAETIRIGIDYPGDQQAAYARFGIEDDQNPGDPEVIDRAIANYFNQRGGFAGRKLELVFHYTQVNEGTWDSQAQEACSFYGEDERVFAVVTATQRSEGIVTCLAKKNTPVFWYRPGSYPAFPEFLRKYSDFYYAPAQIGLERWAVLVIDGLVGQGLLGKSNRIGLIGYDHPTWRRLADLTRARLKHHGLKAADEVFLYAPPSVAGLGQSASDSSSAVLRFRSRNIDRVVFLDTGGVAPLFFMPQAESQGYRPGYGLATSDWPNLQAQNVPPEQLRTAKGVGWMPELDVPDAHLPPDKPAHAECRNILKATGQPPEAVTACDKFFLLKQALDRVPGLNPKGLRVGVETTGDAYGTTLTLGSRFSPQRTHDAISVVRYFAFFQDCQCFKYVGADRPAP